MICPDHHVSRHVLFHEATREAKSAAFELTVDPSIYERSRETQTRLVSRHPTPLPLSPSPSPPPPLPVHTPPYSSSSTAISPSGISKSTSSSPHATHANSTTSLTGPPLPMNAPTAPEPPPRSCARRLSDSMPTSPSSPTHREAWGSFGSSKSWAKETGWREGLSAGAEKVLLRANWGVVSSLL